MGNTTNARLVGRLQRYGAGLSLAINANTKNGSISESRFGWAIPRGTLSVQCDIAQRCAGERGNVAHDETSVQNAWRMFKVAVIVSCCFFNDLFFSFLLLSVKLEHNGFFFF